jgi:hypothetical protein
MVFLPKGRKCHFKFFKSIFFFSHQETDAKSVTPPKKMFSQPLEEKQPPSKVSAQNCVKNKLINSVVVGVF